MSTELCTFITRNPILIADQIRNADFFDGPDIWHNKSMISGWISVKLGSLTGLWPC